MHKVVETITETSDGPRSHFIVYEKRWWGWKDVSTFDGYRLGCEGQVADWFRINGTPVRTVERPIEDFANIARVALPLRHP